MKNLTYYTLSLSGGKDSVALFLKLLEEGVKLNEVVTVDLGDEYPAIYDVLLYVASICMHEGIKFTVLTIPESKEYKKFNKLSIELSLSISYNYKKCSGRICK